MIRRVNLALMEIANAQRAAEQAARPALHPLAEYYRDWESERVAQREPEASSFTVDLTGNDD